MSVANDGLLKCQYKRTKVIEAKVSREHVSDKDDTCALHSARETSKSRLCVGWTVRLVTFSASCRTNFAKVAMYREL